MLPFQGKNRITSPFGSRSGGNHNGIDIVGDDNRTILAVAGGRVVASTMVSNKSNQTWEWGNYVRVDLPSGERHYYCHLASRNAIVGKTIAEGDVIGVMGNTGKSFGAHLHFEVRSKAGIPVNPTSVLGIKNAVGTVTTAAAAQPDDKSPKGDENMYRLYQIVTASLNYQQAVKEAQSILAAGGRPGIDRAASDGKFRVGNSIFASENFEKVLAQFQDTENTFLG